MRFACTEPHRTVPIDNNTNSKNRRTGWWAPFNVIHSLITAVRLLMNSFYVGFPVSSMLASACCTTKHIRCRRSRMSNFQLDTEDVASIDFTTHTALVFWFVVFRYTADVVDAVRSGPMVCAQHLNVATRLYWWWYWHSYAVDKHGFCAEFNWCFAYERCLYRKIGYTARMLRLFDLFAMQSEIIPLSTNAQCSHHSECTELNDSLGSLSVSVLSQNDWFQKFIWRNWIRPRPWFTATNRYIWQKFHYIFVHMFLVRCKQQWFTSGNKIIFHKFVW